MMRVVLIECEDVATGLQIINVITGNKTIQSRNDGVVEVQKTLPISEECEIADKLWKARRDKRLRIKERASDVIESDVEQPKKITRADVIREILAKGPHTKAALEAEIAKTPQTAPWSQIYSIVAYMVKRGEIIQDEERGVWRLAKQHSASKLDFAETK